jgi:hypothetical protein
MGPWAPITMSRLMKSPAPELMGVLENEPAQQVDGIIAARQAARAVIIH